MRAIQAIQWVMGSVHMDAVSQKVACPGRPSDPVVSISLRNDHTGDTGRA